MVFCHLALRSFIHIMLVTDADSCPHHIYAKCASIVEHVRIYHILCTLFSSCFVVMSAAIMWRGPPLECLYLPIMPHEIDTHTQ